MQLFILVLKQDLIGQNNQSQLTGGATVCANSNNGALNLTGYSGAIVRWETATTPSGPWLAMLYTQPFYLYTNLNQSAWFRAVTKDGNFPEVYSNAEAVICQPVGNNPVITGPTQLCTGFNATASLVSAVSSTPVWQYSQNNWQTQTTLTTSSSSSISLSSVIPPFHLRLISQDGVCPLLQSNTLAILAAQASNSGTISGINSACSSVNAFTLGLTGQAGAVNFWEIAASTSGPYTMINGSAGLTSLPQANLFQTTYYRVKVQNPGCNAATSPIHTVEVQTPSSGGFIVGSTTMCNGSNTGSLILLGSNGNAIQWQFTTNGGANWSNSAGTGTLLNLSNISVNRIYRAQVQNGICPVSTSSSHTLNIENPPSVLFSFSNTCSGIVCNFNNLTQFAITHHWQFGDGTSSTMTSPTHSYSAAGNYIVKLKSFSPFGCKDSSSAQLTIYPLPTPAYISSNTACAGTSLQFISTSTISSGNIVSQTFDFNEGASPIAAAVISHSFSSAGTKMITLSCTSNFGCSQSVTKNLQVHPKPLADFQLSNTCVGKKMFLTDASQISSGSINRIWSFGNGDSSLQTNPNYSYRQAGSYFIKLAVFSDNACQHSTIKPVTIHPLLTATLTTINACAGSSANLSALYNSTLLPKYAQLDFGDGSSSATWQNKHVYHQPGTYTVRFVLETDSGCVSESSSSLLIYPKPLALFSIPAACEKEVLKLTNQSSISSGTYFPIWSINNLQSNENTPNFVLPSAGLYSIELVVVSNYGCRDTARKISIIYPRPQTSFSTKGNCQFQTVLFQNTSVVTEGQIAAVEWNFGDLSSSNLWQSQKKYDIAGIYSITLTCSSNENCSASETKTIQIFPLAKAGFEDVFACEGQVAKLINTAQIKDGNFSSFWSVDKNEMINTNDYTLQHLPAGRHHIKLMTETNSFCRDSVEENIFIYPTPELQLKADTLVNLGEEIQLQSSGASTYTWLPDYNIRTTENKLVYCRPDSSIRYTCFGQSENGCITEKTLHISVRKNYQLKIYNLLTPDGNGLNDTWEIENIQAYPDNKVLVFDQWNNLILEETNYQNNWKGTNSRGELLPPGAYFYQISFASSSKVYQGYLSLLLTR